MAKRLDRVLSNAGAGTRSEVRGMIRDGRVSVSGTVQRCPEAKVLPGEDEILLDHKRIAPAGYLYVMMNKPAGVVTASRDKKQKTVMDFLPDELSRRGLFPVGRLDKDTVGLLIITDDGELCHRLLSPARHVDKRYLAKVEGRLTDREKDAFEKGIDIGENEKCLPARLGILETDEAGSLVEITIREGKYHQIKRMFHAVGSRVLTLKRYGVGPIMLDRDLPEGGYRMLRSEEVRRLYACAGLNYGESD